jgi:TonB system transport protein ExbD (group 1)
MAMKPLDDELEVTHDINVTPFIDVVLVLLIIFMVAAPLATVNVPVNLPAAASSEQPPPTKPLYLTLRLNHELVLGDDTPVPDGQLVPVLEQATAGNHEQRIYIRADKGLAYGDLMELLGQLQKANFTQVALVGMDKS